MSESPVPYDEVDSECECFFVTPIGEEGSPQRKQANTVGKHIVAKSAALLGLTLTRADRLAEPGQISHQVIEHVVAAKAVVADLTGSNPNVFYELALRHGAQKPVALIAHKDDMPKLPFDISAERVTPYDHRDLDDVEQVIQLIAAQLRRAIQGPVVSPVATALNFQRLTDGDPTHQAIADLTNQVARLGRGQQQLQDLVGNRLPNTLSGEQLLAANLGVARRFSGVRKDAKLGPVEVELVQDADRRNWRATVSGDFGRYLGTVQGYGDDVSRSIDEAVEQAGLRVEDDAVRYPHQYERPETVFSGGANGPPAVPAGKSPIT